MANYKLVKIDDLSIVTSYEASEPKKFGGPWGNPQIHKTVAVPENMDADCVEAVLVDGEIELQESQALIDAKAQSARERKLDLLRALREDKLKEMDHMAVDVALGTRTDGSDVATYKSDLLAITNPYKDENGNADSTIDLLQDDLSDLTWPVKP